MMTTSYTTTTTTLMNNSENGRSYITWSDSAYSSSISANLVRHAG